METAIGAIDVVLPCLNEAGALPWLLARMPADRGRQRLNRRFGTDSGISRRRGGARAAARFRRRLSRRAAGGRQRDRLHHGRGRVVRPGGPGDRYRSGQERRGRLDARAAGAAGQEGVAGARARWQHGAIGRAAAACRGPAARPRPDARRPARRAAGARPRGPPVRLSARNGDAGRRGRLADRRGARALLPAHRQVEGDRHGRRHRQGRARHAQGAGVVRGMSWFAAARPRGAAAAALAAQVIVIAKEPVPGRVKTRLTPPFTPEDAASLATAALADTLAAVRTTPVIRHVLALDGAPGDWLPAGFDVVAQRGSGLDERLAAAFADTHASLQAPMVLIGMDTPQVSQELLADAAESLVR